MHRLILHDAHWQQIEQSWRLRGPLATKPNATFHDVRRKQLLVSINVFYVVKLRQRPVRAKLGFCSVLHQGFLTQTLKQTQFLVLFKPIPTGRIQFVQRNSFWVGF